MAQNAYQYTPLAKQAPLTASQPRTHSRTKYKAAAWTKKERIMVAIVATVVLALMVGVVYTSMQTTKTTASVNAVQTKIDETKQNNDDLRTQVQTAMSKKNLDKVAKKYGMTLSDNSVRNINQ
ncbi:cell division protein FtsL [Leuconostoc mesenteroides]|uniref:cell division protein FtsL n=1 Tax=Leuconostoc mesenteroides TaxID=1245 RepID=UPI0032DF4DA9